MSGRKSAFEAVALPHLPAVHRLALRLTRNPDDAQDLAQDALTKAFRLFHRFEPGTNGRAWLLKVLVNLFYSRYHSELRRRQIADAAAVGGDHGRFVSTASLASTRDPERDLVERLSADRLREALDALPVDFRAAVVLCDVEGFTYREISEILGCPIGTVMSRIYRGRRSMRGLLLRDAKADTVDLEGYRQSKGGDA